MLKMPELFITVENVGNLLVDAILPIDDKMPVDEKLADNEQAKKENA